MKAADRQELFSRLAGVSMATPSRALKNAPGVAAATRAKVQRIAEVIREATRRAEHLVAGLLLLARTEAADAVPTDAHDFSEVDYEVVLYEERAVVTLEAVPVERVRLATSTVVENHEVTGEVRKEQIEVDDDITTSRSNDGRRDI